MHRKCIVCCPLGREAQAALLDVLARDGRVHSEKSEFCRWDDGVSGCRGPKQARKQRAAAHCKPPPRCNRRATGPRSPVGQVPSPAKLGFFGANLAFPGRRPSQLPYLTTTRRLQARTRRQAAAPCQPVERTKVLRLRRFAPALRMTGKRGRARPRDHQRFAALRLPMTGLGRPPRHAGRAAFWLPRHAFPAKGFLRQWPSGSARTPVATVLRRLVARAKVLRLRRFAPELRMTDLGTPPGAPHLARALTRP